MESEGGLQLKEGRKIRVMSVVLIGAFIGVLNQTLLTTILPKLMQDFSITSSSAQWITTIFMLVNGIMIPITAFLINKFNLRPLFFTAVGFLIVGTLICMIGLNFPMLLIGRSIQALGAGILMPLTQTLLFLIFPQDKRGFAMGMFGLVIGFAPAIGPTVAGWLANTFNWRYLFVIVLVIAIFDIIFGFVSLCNMTTLSDPKLDMISVLFSTLGFGGLLYGFSAAGNLGWLHPAVYVTIILAVLALVLFVQRQLKLSSPLLEVRIFKYKDFSVSMILVSLMFMLFIGNLTILPIYMQNMMKWSSLETGLILLPGGLVMGLLSPITGRLFDELGGRLLSIAGMVTIMIGALLIAQFNLETHQLYVALVFSITMLGNAMIMTPMTTQALNALPSAYVPHGTAMNNTIRQVSAAIGTGILVTLMTQLGKSFSTGSIEGAITGLNVTYYIVAGIALLGAILAFFLDKNK
ncbi:MFS transporter [Staphylococcus hyicus]|uniref:MDR family MFS transporter n=1 Tax=Staphylococcus hyicus TaxID=1284 RepID=UPI000D1F1E10|nr:MDR family MFS transporter [Staphylococcus hyicus]PTJ71129.1 MFS transporter [Staphylococcus hyicus]PTJ88437.1 MFS transporter [Staphylococcus hyicus]